MNKRVLITGGFGFLGGRIAMEVARKPTWQVRLSSRRNMGVPSWLPDAQITPFDLSKPNGFDDALRDVQAVVHLAAINEGESRKFPEKAVEINSLGTQRLLNVAIKMGIERFIYFSTIHVYGSPLAGHITEYSIPRPIGPYAITHHEAEKFVLSARENGSIQGMVLRLSNGFGAPTWEGADCWTLLVNDLCRQAVRDKKLVLRSSGMQQRDFIGLNDVGRVVSLFLDLPQGSCSDGLFNVGSGHSISVLAMAQRIVKCCQEVLGYEPQIVRPRPGTDEKISEFNYDITKLKQTGFTLQGDADEEIKKTLRFCMSMPQGTRV